MKIRILTSLLVAGVLASTTQVAFSGPLEMSDAQLQTIIAGSTRITIYLNTPGIGEGFGNIFSSNAYVPNDSLIPADHTPPDQSKVTGYIVFTNVDDF